jgi:5,5'-dehydrodivanillate O-demethylase
MLSVKENERLTRVGPGTPMGDLLRRYWYPVAAAAQLLTEPTKAIKVLDEKLVLYKDRSGTLGLVQEACAHRRVNLLYGIPEQHGLRCPYHGWLYNEKGQCLEQPAEAPDSTFKDRIKLTAYPVQEMGGLIWAYLGPEPTPLLPRWEIFVREGVLRDIGACVVPANWVQAMENSMDPVHLEWLHGKYWAYVLERMGETDGVAMSQAQSFRKRHLKIGFDVFEYGIIKRRVFDGGSEDDDEWKVGHPVVFPNTLLVGNGFQIRVPIDDKSHWHVWYNLYAPGAGVELPKQDVIPYFEVPVYDEQGRFRVDHPNGGDIMAWAAQGEIADRSVERLAESDRGIILYRRQLREQMAKAEEGQDPMNVFRDPAQNECLQLPIEANFYNRGPGKYRKGMLKTGIVRWSPIADMVDELMAKSGASGRYSGALGG